MPDVWCQGVFTEEDDQLIREAQERAKKGLPGLRADLEEAYLKSPAYAENEKIVDRAILEVAREKLEKRLRVNQTPLEIQEEQRQPSRREMETFLSESFHAAPKVVRESIWKFVYDDRIRTFQEGGDIRTLGGYASPVKSLSNDMIQKLELSQKDLETLRRSGKWIIVVFQPPSLLEGRLAAEHEIQEVAWETLSSEQQDGWGREYERIQLNQEQLSIFEGQSTKIQDARDFRCEVMARFFWKTQDVHDLDQAIFQLAQDETIAVEISNMKEFV